MKGCHNSTINCVHPTPVCIQLTHTCGCTEDADCLDGYYCTGIENTTCTNIMSTTTTSTTSTTSTTTSSTTTSSSDSKYGFCPVQEQCVQSQECFESCCSSSTSPTSPTSPQPPFLPTKKLHLMDSTTTTETTTALRTSTTTTGSANNDTETKTNKKEVVNISSARGLA